MDKLENDMIIKAVVTRLLNEEEIRSTGVYHVSIEPNDGIRLTQVEKVKFGNYEVVGSGSIIISDDNPSRKLSEYEFVEFVKPVYHPDKERKQARASDKEDRLAKLFENISPEDIKEYLQRALKNG